MTSHVSSVKLTMQPIAIVGIGGLFPDPTADYSLKAFWRNIAAARDCVGEVPATRWALDPATIQSQAIVPDRVLSSRAALLDHVTLDCTDLDIDTTQLTGLDRMFHLVLAAGVAAWRDMRSTQINRERTGVILGNIVLPTDATSLLAEDYLGVHLSAQITGTPATTTTRVDPLNRYAAGLPAGLLARALALKGGSYTLDAACASSLYAIKYAVDELLAGRADTMLAGGVSRPDCLYTQMGFSALGALSKCGRAAPFDATADGLVVGEGAGIVVLKRLPDALRDGDTIYATITGIGLSNDIDGNLMSPATEGQLRAMRRAYCNAGWSPECVDLVECHGTGTPLGDAVEFASLQTLWADMARDTRRCVIGSVKSNIGHLLTAAGSAGLIKVLLAMHQKMLPPTANFSTPAARIDLDNSPFAILKDATAWERRNKHTPRRAAVSAFGFGGINAHLLLEEWSPSTPVPATRTIVSKPPDLAIVGIDMQFGSWQSETAVRRLLTGEKSRPTEERQAWGVAESVAGWWLDMLTVPTDRFRIPPTELQAMLPQQLLMLMVVDRALKNAALKQYDHNARKGTGVFVGLELDLNTTNFHLRWWCQTKIRDWLAEQGVAIDTTTHEAWLQTCCDAISPSLDANHTMGSLGGIVASRIARAFRLGGPAFTVSNTECSGLRALAIAARNLQQGDIDTAIVGAVELADPRARGVVSNTSPQGEGAVACIMKRHAEAEADGNEIIAIIKGIGEARDNMIDHACRRSWEHALDEASVDDEQIGLYETHHDNSIAQHRQTVGDVASLIGDVGAVSGLAAVARASLSLQHRLLPPTRNLRSGEVQAPQYWLHNRSDGVRYAAANVLGTDGNCLTTVLQAADHPASLTHAITHDKVVLLPLYGTSQADLLGTLQQLSEAAHGTTDLYRLAYDWWHTRCNQRHHANYCAAIVCNNPTHLDEALIQLANAITGHRPLAANGVYFSPSPLAKAGQLAYVYPGSGNHFHGMGIDLGQRFPKVLERQHNENTAFARQFADGKFWRSDTSPLNHRDVIFGQVWIGGFVTDVIAQFVESPDAVIGYSLGETAGLFATRTWVDRDTMLARINASDLFTDSLVGDCRAAAEVWRLDDTESVDWLVGVVDRSRAEVTAVLANAPTTGMRAYLLIVNTPHECVVGGDRQAVRTLVADLACQFHALEGVSTVHCETAEPVKLAYRKLHLFDTTPPNDVTFYSGIGGGAYTVTRDSAADSIVKQAIQAFDYTRVIESAYADGMRLFVEMGPGKSCTRMIRKILGERPHLALALCVKGENSVINLSHCLARLIAEQVPVTLDELFDTAPTPSPTTTTAITIANRRTKVTLPRLPTPPSSTPTNRSALVAEMYATTQAMAQTEAVFRRVNDTFNSLLGKMPPAANDEVIFDRATCLEIATGSIGRVLGAAFADIDDYPTRVRLPDEPLMLVDRILAIEGTANGLVDDPTVTGRIVTEHDINAGAWYLDGRVIPTALAVEAGQADLFLSAYLGIDHLTRGLAVYRLLDAKITFHAALPGSDNTIRYRIEIDSFFQQNTIWLFRFHFHATVNGAAFLTMKDGLAGFFTPAELANSGGIVQTSLIKMSQPNDVAEATWLAPCPTTTESYDDEALDALRRGDLAACFGMAFADLDLRQPMTLPGGRLTLVHRILELIPDGGCYGLGRIVGEADIRADDWFLVCHFSDDQVMPGTLMYECCLQTLRVYLLRFGWVGEADKLCYQPIPEVESQLKCRGQVIATTRKVRYEITIKALSYVADGTPTAIADALMYADGKAIVRMDSMSLRIDGLKADAITARWQHASQRKTTAREVLFDNATIYAFAAGNPSDAFGAPYRVFDNERVIARLPRPPYQFLDRIVDLQNCRAFELRANGRATAEYDIPPDAWYFSANHQPVMPFAVLLEVALQPCGWLAAYLGSALTSDVDLSFRNLGGNGVQLCPVTAANGTLTTTVTLDKVSQSAGMIIQNYTLTVRDGNNVAYQGDTYFGFFSKSALADQVGIRNAERDLAHVTATHKFDYPRHAPYPAPMLRMIDTISLYDVTGGRCRLGFIRGEYAVDRKAWFFDAHFYQDPVCPGSLGLESFLQLLKIFAMRRWQPSETVLFETPVCGETHHWTYRGQIIPSDQQVTVEATITALDDAKRQLYADGFLIVDGRVIYQMSGFTLALRS